jgi:XTP/dITP diphosphohydrolase
VTTSLAGSLALVVTSPRVAPGLLSRSAWEVLGSADVCLARSLDEPLARAVAEAGLPVETIPDLTAPDGYATGSPPSLARTLVGHASTGAVAWLGSADGDPGLSDAIASEVSRLPEPPVVEIVMGSWDVPGARLLDLVAVMDRLRSPGGCPWDAQQTHESLLPYLTEESAEYAEAVASGDRAHMAEELGDVLLQVVFHARVAEEHPEQPFDIDAVAAGLVDKLVRRHPHVFADVEASTPEEVAANWQRIKEQEREAKRARDGRLD